MIPKFLIAWVIILFSPSTQKIYTATSSTISFFAGTPVEDIDATNKKSISFLNVETGEVIVSIPNKEFRFRRSLMEDHFNENYMESGKYPKSEFKGRIDNPGVIRWTSKEEYDVTVAGTLIIHGVARQRTLAVHLRCDPQKVEADMKFTVALSDHNIDRPQILWEKLAENVTVQANIIYEPYKN